MMSIDQIARALTHMKLKNLSEDIGVSIYHLRRLRQADRNIPYNKLKTVSDYLEGVQEGE